MKEGTGGSGLLIVKVNIENTTKGNPNSARHLLRLPELAGVHGEQKDAALAALGGLLGLGPG